MIKAASYCRVSTDHDDQANSLDAQRRYFREYIEGHPDWELYEVYADEGITGTSTKKRTQFNRMINDAYEGKFQIIITKEVSRFSRNILDTIAYTRELRVIGVAVLFVTDGINTLDPDAELRLSLIASIAQEESRRTSGRVTWGQTRQMEKGVVFGQSLLGYDVKNGKISVNPVGAELVKSIFHKYAVEQMGTSEIARQLTREGCRTYRGNTKWKSNTVLKILNNEKYVGDLLQKKTYTVDYLTHEKRKNKGEVPLIYIKNHHEPIVSREVWDLAQERIKNNYRHGSGKDGHSNRYVFSGKIRCGECGATFVGRVKKNSNGSTGRKWRCYTAANDGSTIYVDAHGNRCGCDIGKLLRDDDAMNMLKTAILNLQIDTDWIINSVTMLVLSAIQTGSGRIVNDPEQIQYEIARTAEKKRNMLDDYFSEIITQEDMQNMKLQYELQIKSLQEKLQKSEERKRESNPYEEIKTSIENEVRALLSCETESEVLYKNILDHIFVYKDRHMELKLKDLPLIFQFAG